MSKIFEALRKTEGATRNIVDPLLSPEEQELTARVARMHGEAPAAAMEETPAPGGVAVAEESPTEQEPVHLGAATIHLPASSPILPFDGTDSRAAEQYRIIRTKIRHHPLHPRKILVSSPMPGDGKTISAINLAGALTFQEGETVLLVDGDLRRSSVARALGIPVSPGLSEVLRGTVPLDSAIVQIEQLPNLYVLPAGESTRTAAEFLATENWKLLIEQFEKRFGYIIFDAPPIASVADYDLLQMSCDGVVMVIRQDYTNRELCQRAFDTVPKSKQLGVILNCVDEWFLWKTQNYYYYSRREQ